MPTSRFENIKMQEDQTFSALYSKLGDIVNSSFNIQSSQKNFEVFFKKIKALVTIIEESKDIDFVRVNELVGYLQIYEIILSSSQKPREYAFKASKNEEGLENFEKVDLEEFTLLSKRIKNALKFYKKTNKELDSEKG